MVGRRQPRRPPTSIVKHWATAFNQLCSLPDSACCQTSPVSLSSTASPPNAVKTVNRFVGSFGDQLENAVLPPAAKIAFGKTISKAAAMAANEKFFTLISFSPRIPIRNGLRRILQTIRVVQLGKGPQSVLDKLKFLRDIQGDSMRIKDLKENLAYSCNILANEGHWDNILGHVTVRIPGTNKALMKPHGFGFEEIRPQHIITVDIETGKKIERMCAPPSGFYPHPDI